MRRASIIGVAGLLAAGIGTAFGVPAPDVQAELAELVSTAGSDAARQTAAAEYAHAHGLVRDADRLYRIVLKEHPKHDAAYRGLQSVHEGRKLAKDSKRYEAAKALLPGFREYETPRYVILSDAPVKWSRAQGGRLERAHHQFQRYCKRAGLRPLPLRHKLVCVLFDAREDYAAFARKHDRMDADWVYGYYAPRGDRIVLFNGEGESDADEFARARTIATTIHEAIHQLQYHARIQTVHVQYPLWIGEGFATAFETEDAGAAFGPEEDYAPRRRRFERLLDSDRIIPLRELLAYENMPAGDRATIHAVYSESYALVTWLARHRRDEMVDYLDRMLREPSGRPGGSRHLKIFIQSFGDPDLMQKVWLRDERMRVAEARLHRDPAEEARLMAYLAWEDALPVGDLHEGAGGRIDWAVAGAEEHEQ